MCELSVHRQEKTVCRAGTANPYGDNYGLRLINTHDGVASRLITFLTSFGRSSLSQLVTHAWATQSPHETSRGG